MPSRAGALRVYVGVSGHGTWIGPKKEAKSRLRLGTPMPQGLEAAVSAASAADHMEFLVVGTAMGQSVLIEPSNQAGETIPVSQDKAQ